MSPSPQVAATDVATAPTLLGSRQNASASKPAADERSISVIIPTFSSSANPRELLEGYRSALQDVVQPKEVICVGGKNTRDKVEALRREGFDWGELVPVELSVALGEDEALRVGLSRAKGDVILTFAGWPEVDYVDVRQMLAALADHDLVVGYRIGQKQTWLSRIRTGTFHWLVERFFGQRFQDMFCRVRLGRRAVFEEAVQFGVRQHFIPLLAVWRGFKAGQVELRTRERSEPQRRFRPLGHFRAFIDLITLFVTLKFLQRPLRFFGFLGMPMLIGGLVVTAYLVGARLLGFISLSDRPILIFSVLMIVLGIQIIAIGLVGEIIIYTSNRRLKNYEIAEVVRSEEES